MKALIRAGVVIAFCAGVAGCAGPARPPDVTAEGTPASTLSVLNARDAVTPGKSTKADVVAALGKATVVSFNNDFEVWVYRFVSDLPAAKQGGNAGLAGGEKGNLARTEFVLLFDSSGVVTKARVRDAPGPGEARRQ